MSDDLTKRVDFGLIRYANCWEDADLLVNALQIKPGDRVLSIASAGDNSFSLLTSHPESVTAIDVNLVQLHLCELKKAAFQLNDHAAFLELLGFTASTRRRALFDSIKTKLPQETATWFEAQFQLIENGVILQGKFERYFAFFRKRLLPLIHSKKDISDLFATKSAAAQLEFYNKTWNNWRWKLFFRVFFSRYVMGKYGRDPEFMNEVKVSVSSYIFQKAEQHLQRSEAQDNLYLHHILTGDFGKQLPHYARAEHFETIKKNIERIQFVQGYAEEAAGTFQAFNLSNIFEYMPREIALATANKLAEKATSGARFAFWNLMVPRSLENLSPENFRYNRDSSEGFTKNDNGFFYHRFLLETRV